MKYILIVLVYLMFNSYSFSENITLANTCPKYFHLNEGGCEFFSLYHLYNSVQDKGLGGTKTSLPKIRDGFQPELIDLGRYLFFDPILSNHGERSCASCHDPRFGFADGRQISPSLSDVPLVRSAPSLWNVGFNPILFWDGRAETLEEQAILPILHPDEMGGDPQKIIESLNQSKYLELIKVIYPDISVMTLEHVAQALAAFQSTLVSFNSPYDRYAHGDTSALSPIEIKGLNVFRSFVARCAECHTPPLFTNNQIAVIGLPLDHKGTYDLGAGSISGERQLNGGFKVPTLRNITLTQPYMHDGRFESLQEVLAFYNGGRGHASESDELLIHWHIVSPDLRHDELNALAIFLETLEDTTALPTIPSKLPSGLTPITYRVHMENTNE